MKRDLYSGIAAMMALAPAVQAAAVNGVSVDVSEAVGVVFVLSTGAIVAAGDFGAVVEESADGVTWAAAPVARVKAPLLDDSLEADKVYRLGYYGKLRYARLSLTKSGGTSIAAGAVAVLRPIDRPVP